MQKPTIFVTRRWPKKTIKEMKKFFEVTINQDDRPLTQNEIADGGSMVTTIGYLCE